MKRTELFNDSGPTKHTFEIVAYQRDINGNVIYPLRKKTYSSDRASDISRFWLRMCPPKPKRVKKSELPDAAEAGKILNELYKNNEKADS